MKEVSDSEEGVAQPFEDFVAERLVRLLRFTGALTGDPHQAEDLVQEVLVRVFRDWARIGALDIPEAYVRRMLVNEHLSWRRRWSRFRPQSNVEPDWTDPDHAVAITDRDDVRQRLARLPRTHRVALTLRYYAGLSDTEIASIMGCRPGTVRGYASRALSTLRIDDPDTSPGHTSPRPVRPEARVGHAEQAAAARTVRTEGGGIH